MQILTFYERQKIEYHLKLKLTQRDIAKQLKRNQSDICREILRNKDRDGKYRAAVAQRKAEFKSHKTNKRKLETNEQLHDYVEALLKSGLSPELIAGRLTNHPPGKLTPDTLSHEQIYDYIYNGEGKWEGWYHYLLRKRPKRQKRKGRKKQAKTLIKERVSIQDRPDVINKRKRFGDWESDFVEFKKQKTGLSVQYERKAMLTKIHKVKNKTAVENEQAINQTIEDYPAELALSFTFDNGLENTCHTKVRDNYQVQTFFCDPYSAWQKGGVENTIGLIRRYLPRETNLDTITDEQIQDLEDWLNNRPRKKLNYLTPNEVISTVVNN